MITELLSNLGDLDSEVNELDTVNLFLASIEGNPENGNQANSFRYAGYDAIYYPGFSIWMEQNGLEVQRPSNPDVLLYNVHNGNVILMEVKGEDSVGEERHLDQLERASHVEANQIEDYLMQSENVRIVVHSIIPGIVYNEVTVQRCLESPNGREIVADMRRRRFLICRQEQGGFLRAINPELILFDETLRGFLTDGIPLPLIPKKQFYFIRRPCIKGIIIGILNLVEDMFYSGEQTNQVELTTGYLHDVAFDYAHLNEEDLTTALNIIRRLGFCTQIDRPRYRFRFDRFNQLMNAETMSTLMTRLRNLNCTGEGIDTTLTSFL